MNNQFKNKMVDNGTTPKFNTGMFFCVHMNTSPVALEDCFRNGLSQEQTKEQMLKEQQDRVEVNSQRNRYGYEDQLIQRQGEIIKSLEQQISDAKQELIEKDKEIARLENDLEEISEELFLEVNLR
jgi:predicted RNase H-like nuclease (RuvC/YqgF family)